MKGNVYRITGNFNPEIGFKLASNLNGNVAYAYRRTSWEKLKKQLDVYNNPKKFFFLELEIQQSFHHIKKLIENGLKILIIEETDLLLPEYDHGSFDNFVKEINEICSLGVNVYFNSTWKEEELSDAFKNIGLTVHKLTFKNEDVILNENEKFFKSDDIKTEEKETIEQVIDIKTKEKETIEHITDEKVKTKNIEHKNIKNYKNNTNENPTDLELFYSKPKSFWQKVSRKFSYFLEKITNNF